MRINWIVHEKKLGSKKKRRIYVPLKRKKIPESILTIHSSYVAKNKMQAITVKRTLNQRECAEGTTVI